MVSMRDYQIGCINIAINRIGWKFSWNLNVLLGWWAPFLHSSQTWPEPHASTTRSTAFDCLLWRTFTEFWIKSWASSWNSRKAKVWTNKLISIVFASYFGLWVKQKNSEKNEKDQKITVQKCIKFISMRKYFSTHHNEHLNMKTKPRHLNATIILNRNDATFIIIV